MPTYHYVCAKCDHEFEIVQPMADSALSVCPKTSCGLKRWGKGKVQRRISGGAGLIFKGSGFYITDYRSEGYKAAAAKDVAPKVESTPAKTETPKTPAKPASTPAKGSS